MIEYTRVLLLSLVVCFGFSNKAQALEPADDVLTVSEAVAIAKKNNSRVSAAKENIVSAEFKSKSARADLFPKISANYSFTSLSEEPFAVMNGMSVQMAHQKQSHWDVTLAQPLFAGGAISTRYKMSKLNIEMKKQEKQESLLDVTEGVKSAYYAVLLTQKLLLVSNDTVTSLDAHKNDAQRFYERGVIRLNDLLRAKVAHSQAMQNQERVNAAVRMAVSNLNQWLGFAINRDTKIQVLDTVSYQEYELEALLQQGIEKRPALQKMRLVLKTLDNSIKLERSAYFPEVALLGGYEQNGNNPLANDNDFSNDHNAFVALRAKWALFDFGQRQANVSRAGADKRAYREQIRVVEDGIKLEIKDAYLNMTVARTNIGTSAESLAQAKENMRITQLGYRQQAATSTEVLDARLDLTQAHTNYYQALYGYLQATSRLERSIGGELEGRVFR